MKIEKLELTGYVRSSTDCAVLFESELFNGWLPRSKVSLVSGQLEKGCYAAVIVPLWILRKNAGLLSSRSGKSAPHGDIPWNILETMILLCDPAKHSNSDDSIRVMRWLLKQKGVT